MVHKGAKTLLDTSTLHAPLVYITEFKIKYSFARVSIFFRSSSKGSPCKHYRFSFFISTWSRNCILQKKNQHKNYKDMVRWCLVLLVCWIRIEEYNVSCMLIHWCQNMTSRTKKKLVIRWSRTTVKHVKPKISLKSSRYVILLHLVSSASKLYQRKVHFAVKISKKLMHNIFLKFLNSIS